MKVVHCLPNAAWGGAQRVCYEILKHLISDGATHRYELAYLDAPTLKQSLPHHLTIPIHHFGWNGSVYRWRDRRRCVQALKSYFQNDPPAIVHSHLWPTAQIIGEAIDHRRTKHIVHIHDQRAWLAERSWKSHLRRISLNCSLKRSHASYLSVSRSAWNYAQRHLAHLRNTEVKIICNGTDIRRFAGSEGRLPICPSKRIHIGTAARLSPEKGIHHLIDACAILRRRGVDVELHIAGSGSEEQQLRTQTSNLGLNDDVQFLGSVENIERFYRSINIFVLASTDSEGMPLTLIEAMASGTPVVCTRFPGAEETVQDGLTGLLAEPGIASSLADALQRAITNPASTLERAMHAQHRAQECHDWSGIVKKILEVYDSHAMSSNHPRTHQHSLDLQPT